MATQLAGPLCMLIKVEQWGTFPCGIGRDDAVEDEQLGLKRIKNSFGNTFKVINQQLFIWGVVKYSIKFKTICKL